MFRHLVLALVLPLAAATTTALQSWPAWRKKYNAVVASKSALEVKAINKDIEASSAPTNSDEQLLWSWFSQVPAGTEKTQAKAAMQEAYTSLGGDTTMMASFISSVTTEYGKTANKDKPKECYNDVYRAITDVTAPDQGTKPTLYTLHQAYHSMSSEQQKTAEIMMESGLSNAWDTNFKLFGNFKTDYKTRTESLLIIVALDTATVRTGTGDKGVSCTDAYKKATANNDEKILGLFDRRIAAALAATM